MRNKKLLLGAFVVLCCSGFAFSQMPTPPPAKTPGDALDAVLSIAEHEFVPAAEAMPEDKYSFAPSAGKTRGCSQLHIRGQRFAGKTSGRYGRRKRASHGQE